MHLAPKSVAWASLNQTVAAALRSFYDVTQGMAEVPHGWHIDAIAEHLEAVTDGEIIRLLINVPPGTMKSLAVGVLWPAWEWGPRGSAALRYIGAAHAQDLAMRDNMRMRRLVKSDWYQGLWPLGISRPIRTPSSSSRTRRPASARRSRRPHDRPPRRPGDLRRPALGRGRALGRAAHDGAAGVLGDRDHRLNRPSARRSSSSCSGCTSRTSRATSSSASSGTSTFACRWSSRPSGAASPRSASGTRGAGRRAALSRALPGRGRRARQARHGRARHRRPVPAAARPRAAAACSRPTVRARRSRRRRRRDRRLDPLLGQGRAPRTAGA